MRKCPQCKGDNLHNVGRNYWCSNCDYEAFVGSKQDHDYHRAGQGSNRPSHKW